MNGNSNDTSSNNNFDYNSNDNKWVSGLERLLPQTSGGETLQSSFFVIRMIY